jgi:hypothetical protein
VREEDVGKGCRRMTVVQIMGTHVVNGKMRPAETVPGMGGEGIKENGGGDDTFDML